MALSILHRVTGVGLCAGAILLVWWLSAAAQGPAAYDGMQHFLASWLGRALIFCWSVALFYHLCNGLRHLWWDTGRGFDPQSFDRVSYIVIAGTAVLTAIAWAAVIMHGRG